MALIEMAPIDFCPLCGGENWKDCIFVVPMGFEQDKTGVREMKYVVCQCGFIFTDKYIKDIDAYYRQLYRVSPDTPVGEVSSENLGRELERAGRLVSEILPRVKQVKRALDFGSSSGTLLSKLAEYYDCEVQGVELSGAYREYSKSHGVPATDDLWSVSNEFDLITAIHVLEHTTNPVGMLKNLREKAGSKTMFVIEVPFFDPRINHPALYTLATLRAVVEKAGLRIVDTVLGKDITVFANA